MAAVDLITRSRANQALFSGTGLLSLSSDENNLVDALVSAVSAQIVKYCNRDFNSKSYDELYGGSGEGRLLLRQYPIQSVESVRYRPVTVLKITNTVAANVQARVSVTSTGLKLVRVNAGVKTTDTSVTFAGNVSLTALAGAVNALGSGWSAQVVGDATNYGGWPSADLYWPSSYGDGVGGQGALQCVAGSFAELKMHTYELSGYQWDPRGWLLRAIPYTDPELLHPEDLVWPVGINNFRIQYTAGYTTVPQAVAEACAEWVAALFWLTKRDPQIAHSLGSSTGTTYDALSTAPGWGKPPGRVQTLLAPFRRLSISTNQG
jgi:hypothetical protein